MNKVLSKIRRAIQEYNMIDENDKIGIGVSGGKDSMCLLYCLNEIKKYYPKNFDILAIILDPLFFNVENDYSEILNFCKKLKINYIIQKTDLWSIIFNIRHEKSPCSLCSKMRKGILNSICKANNCNKLALGHHLDDAIETFFINLFRCSILKCFAPMTHLSRMDIFMIRPMILCEEQEIISFVNNNGIPICKSKCPVDGLTERQKMKDIILKLDKAYPNLKQKVLYAMRSIHLSSF